ncbi:hypothetical protein M407DRAFT_226291 [Tulasnella calospora MUT 4182]|uniref:Uncharacterized protein n=1 Tax=Tulasnella calospora MUT 4182 TaxID=1051891 RepID=A0A0C3QNS0_9AGAM|nr:hypothetical protein M407DRAFT_226291 [Tulasnella calospora MUT 4182]
MTEWKDPTQVAYHAKVFSQVLLVLIGFYGWEVLCGLGFDAMIIKKLANRELKRSSPTVVYFLCKYGTLIAIIGLNVTNNVTNDFPCQVVYTNNQFWGNVAIGGASTLLMFRSLRTYYAKAQLPVAGTKQRWTWKTLPKIKLLLYLGSAGQWAILLYNVTGVKSSKAPDGSSCVVTDTEPVLLMVLYCYTMAFDFLVLAVCAIGLIRIPSPESRIWRLVFIVLRLNPIMEVMFAVPACVLRRLNKPRNTSEVELGNIVRNAHLDRPYQPNQSPKHRFQPSVYFPDVLPRPLRGHPQSPAQAHTDATTTGDLSRFNVEEVHTISVPIVSINASRNGEVRSLPPRRYLVRTTPVAIPRSKNSTEDEATSRGSSTDSPTTATCSLQGYGYGWGTAKTMPPTLISKSFLWSPKKKGGSDSQGVSTGSGSGIIFASRGSEEGSKFDLEDYGPGGVGDANVGMVGVDIVALDASQPVRRVSVDDGDDNGTLVNVSRDSVAPSQETAEPPHQESRRKESS